MEQYISKTALIAEIEKRKSELQSRIVEFGTFESNTLGLFQDVDLYDEILSFLDTLEVKDEDATNIKTEWSPNKKQMESLKDMLKWNIGEFNYQKWMEVNSLYNDLIKMLDYETNK